VKINRAYRVELDPNNVQRTALLRHAGCARWAYNWGLRRKIEEYETHGKSPGAMALHRDLNALKKTATEDGGVPWMYEVSKCAPQEALRDLDRAFQHFFRRCKQGDKRKGFPRFKSRKRGIGGFRLTGTIKVTEDGRHVQLPKLGLLRVKERGYLPGPDGDGVRILSATVTEQAGHWFVSLAVEQEIADAEQRPTGDTVGVDVGIKTLATVSDGRTFDNPKSLRGAEARLRRLQKAVSRKQRGSNNRKKAVEQLRRQHYRVTCIRRDSIHKATSAITKSASAIGIETLNVKGMMQNRRLSKALSDASLSEFLRQIEYKARWRGAVVVKADRFYPSSKTCSGCGSVKSDLTLGDRTYRCESCGLVIGRDLNAALNLRALAVSSTVTACGEDVRPNPPLGVGDAASLKQEPNSRAA
jgi:putative transposase